MVKSGQMKELKKKGKPSGGQSAFFVPGKSPKQGGQKPKKGCK